MTTEQMDWNDDNARQHTVENEGSTTTEPDIVAKSAFDPANFNEVTLIMLMRVYDLQLALLSAIDADKASLLVEFHAKGQSFCPPPAFVEYEENASDS